MVINLPRLHKSDPKQTVTLYVRLSKVTGMPITSPSVIDLNDTNTAGHVLGQGAQYYQQSLLLLLLVLLLH